VREVVGAGSRRIRHVVLVGAMGSGKTTIGVPLAGSLHRPLVDNDAQLVDRAGMTAAELAEREGVDKLHQAEAENLLAALRSPAVSVITAAASTIASREVRDALEQDAFVVWLRADPAALAARMASSETRPFSSEEPARVVEQQARDRDPLFAQVADLVVEPDRSTPDAVVARILERLPNGLTGPER
jgi:shikimate kinase